VKRIPILPTLLVLLAAGYMVHLGLWQLDRLHQKDALLARYTAAIADPAAVAFPTGSEAEAERALYRRSSVDCLSTSGDWQSVSGRSAQGEAGYVHVTLCGITAGKTAYVQAGWSRNPKPPRWSGGPVQGYIAPFHKGARLVADPPVAGLDASARPDPSDIPNNHFAYAVQWFLFAGVALVIYGLALWKRQKA
jgi:surfeit locus 1 family protein